MKTEKDKERRKEQRRMLLNGDAAPDNISLTNEHRSNKRSTPKASKIGQFSKTSAIDNFSTASKM